MPQTVAAVGTLAAGGLAAMAPRTPDPAQVAAGRCQAYQGFVSSGHGSATPMDHRDQLSVLVAGANVGLNSRG